jgi:hypothetical protein
MSILVQVIRWEDMQEVLDLVVEIELKVLSGNRYAYREIGGLLQVHNLLNFLHLFSDTAHGGVLPQRSDEALWLFNEAGSVVRSFDEKLIK